MRTEQTDTGRNKLVEHWHLLQYRRNTNPVIPDRRANVSNMRHIQRLPITESKIPISCQPVPHTAQTYM